MRSRRAFARWIAVPGRAVTCACFVVACFAAQSPVAEFTCAQIASDPAALRIETVPAGGFRDALVIEPNDAMDLQVARVGLLRGSCEDRVTGHNLPYVYFRDGWAAAWPSILRLDRRRQQMAQAWELISPGFAETLDRFVPAAAQADQPQLDAGEFAGAFHSGASDWYLGVWRRPGRSVVASYFRAADGSFSAPRIVLSSRFPIRSANFWGQIDGVTMVYGYPSGSPGVTVDTGEGLLAYSLSGLGLAGPAVSSRTTD